METKKTGAAIANAVGMIVLVIAAVIDLYSITITDFNGEKASSVLILLALLSAGIYFSYGAKKDAAPYYKGFLVIFALSEFIRIALGQMPKEIPTELLSEISNEVPNGAGGTLISVMTDVLLFAMLCVLALATDLGKSKSMTLGYIVIAVSLFEMIKSVVPVLIAGESVFMIIVGTGTRLVLCLALHLMIIGKYKDKEERHTK